MKSPHLLASSTILAAASFFPSPTARATLASGDSADTLVETRWVQADSSDILIDTRTYVFLAVTAVHGTVVPPERQFTPGASVDLTATPDIGYVFNKWTDAATGSANPLTLLMDFDKSLTAHFIQDSRDPDADNLTNYQELVVFGTNPNLADTDEDGFDDGYEVAQGFSPTSADSSPDTRMVIYTAAEIRFGAGQGLTYRIESSFDLQNWSAVESGIAGSGGEITRFYTIQAMPKRYFRAVRE